MKMTAVTRFEIKTEGTGPLRAEALRLADGCFHYYTATDALGVWKGGHEVSLGLELYATGADLDCLRLLPVDRERLGCINSTAARLQLIETYVLMLATAIKQANCQESVMVIRTDANGPAVVFV